MKLYVCGPITGIENYKESFKKAQCTLMRAGYDIVNPCELNSALDPWQACMKKDIPAMLSCDGIALLPGWENSKGAKLELHIAQRVCLPVKAVSEWCDKKKTSFFKRDR